MRCVSPFRDDGRDRVSRRDVEYDLAFSRLEGPVVPDGQDAPGELVVVRLDVERRAVPEDQRVSGLFTDDEAAVRPVTVEAQSGEEVNLVDRSRRAVDVRNRGVVALHRDVLSFDETGHGTGVGPEFDGRDRRVSVGAGLVIDRPTGLPAPPATSATTAATTATASSTTSASITFTRPKSRPRSSMKSIRAASAPRR
jgi:hypothetical protein